MELEHKPEKKGWKRNFGFCNLANFVLLPASHDNRAGTPPEMLCPTTLTILSRFQACNMLLISQQHRKVDDPKRDLGFTLPMYAPGGHADAALVSRLDSDSWDSCH